jgi:hypothetical protein
MISAKSALRLLLAVLAGLLCSCIESREEFWLNADGGGRAEIHFSLPASAAKLQGGDSGIREMIAAFLKDTPEITNARFEVLTVQDRTHVKIHAEFDSALDLMEVAKGSSIQKLPSAATHFAGEVDARFHGRTLALTRTTAPGKALPGAAFLPASQFTNRRLITILHLPAAATESNATRVENHGRTLIWETPLAAAIQTPVTTRFQMPVPIPWGLVTAITLPLASLAVFAFLKLRKARKQRTQPT